MHTAKYLITFLVAGLSCLPPGVAQAAPVLNTTDFVTAVTGFNGFESIPNDGTYYTGGTSPYTEGGISVTEMNGNSGNSIWVSIAQSSSYFTEGNYAWYPNGGDNGYTKIMLQSGAEISAISMLFRSYSPNVTYELLDGGVSVLTGTLLADWGVLGRIGFSGGGFDEILLRGGDLGAGIGDGALNALQIDSIKVGTSGTIPEPGTLALLGLGAMGLAASRRRTR
jgi:hypothetical protein